MARHRTRVRLARSLRALVLGAVAAGAATALFEWDMGRELVAPLGLLALAPPVIYVILALVVAPTGQRTSWAMSACGVNAAIGLATTLTLSFSHPLSFEGAIMRAFGAFVPAPLIHLAAAPMVLLAFRPRVKSPRAVARGRGVVTSRSAGASAAGPNYDDVLRLPPLTLAAMPGAAVFEQARPEVKAVLEPEAPSAPDPAPSPAAPPPPPSAPAPRAAAPKVAAPVPPAPAMPDAPEEPMLRIRFARVADQLPPDVFVLPPQRLGESLREPHTIVVPQRLVVPQLREGAIEIPWTLIEDQFAELALAVPRGEMRKRYPDWVLSLPLDEVIGQIPADLIQVAAPAADLSDIGSFPAPFKPGPPTPESELEEPPVVFSPDFATPAPPAVSAPPPAASVAPPPVPAPPAPPAAAPAPIVPPPSRPAAVPLSVPAPRAPMSPPSAAPPVVSAPAAPPSVSASAEPRGGRRDEQLTVLARALAVALAPAGALEYEARRIGGHPLVTFAAPSLEREAIDALAARGLTLLDRLAPWAFDQVTVRTSRLACVLVPLASGGAVVAGVRRGTPIALLEILTARARGGIGRAAGRVAVPPAVTITPVTDGNRRVGEAARALDVFGALVPTEATPDRGAPGVYVFAGRADAGLAGAARAVHEALVSGHDESALGRLDSVTLRQGRERVIVRPLRMAAGAPALLAAAGDITLTGRAQRAAARAATLLEAR